jgi:hypothetical protein
MNPAPRDPLPTFAAAIARELNDHLTILLCSTERILKGVPQGHPVRVELRDLERAALRCAGITDSLLAFSRRRHGDCRGSLNWFLEYD